MDKKLLDDINSENRVNEVIARDEEKRNTTEKAIPLAETEDLIRQLPKDHNGRNNWLSQFGISDEAEEIRHGRNESTS
ncbi:hypothetical protein KK060_14985 [Fulvivirgaceae bacterium PWU20]|uniref:Uncharacterized protein n=1 Tax=Chryseosolibacter indicus TaxID=2782351 RepID=A0ABS5VX70_9BACT|nr:hypothetical protein [Chryseosolibacter indicus]